MNLKESKEWVYGRVGEEEREGGKRQFYYGLKYKELFYCLIEVTIWDHIPGLHSLSVCISVSLSLHSFLLLFLFSPFLPWEIKKFCCTLQCMPLLHTAHCCCVLHASSAHAAAHSMLPLHTACYCYTLFIADAHCLLLLYTARCCCTLLPYTACYCYILLLLHTAHCTLLLHSARCCCTLPATVTNCSLHTAAVHCSLMLHTTHCWCTLQAVACTLRSCHIIYTFLHDNLLAYMELSWTLPPFHCFCWESCWSNDKGMDSTRGHGILTTGGGLAR